MAIELLPLAQASRGESWRWCCLGWGRPLVTRRLLAAVSDVAHLNWRASAVGVYRLWRDSGYAIVRGFPGCWPISSAVSWAIGVIAGVTFLSGIVAQMGDAGNLPSHRKSSALRSQRLLRGIPGKARGEDHLFPLLAC